MTTIKRFSVLDILDYSAVNLDILTETFGDSFYGRYILTWPEMAIGAWSTSGEAIGYFLGKVEGLIAEKDFHSHVTVFLKGYYC